MGAVVETYFEEVPGGEQWLGARRAVVVAELESKKQGKARTGVRSSSECCLLELELVQSVAVARQ